MPNHWGDTRFYLLLQLVDLCTVAKENVLGSVSLGGLKVCWFLLALISGRHDSGFGVISQ